MKSFGLTNFPATFMDLMNHVLRLYLNFFVIIFINENLMYSRSREKHMQHLSILPHTLRDRVLFTKFSKCEFFLELVTFDGRLVSKDYGRPN